MNKRNIIISVILLFSIIAALFLIFETFTTVEAAGTNSNGTVIITISAVTEINFTVNTLNFGTGSVDGGEPQAEVTSLASGQVTNGSWTPNGGNLTLENIGSTTVNLDMVSNASADDLIGGTGDLFQWNITETASGTCVGVANLTDNGNTWYDVNTTGPVGTRVCTNFLPTSGLDVLYMDFKMVIPSDTSKPGGQALITATGTSV